MKSIDAIAKRALEYKEKGLSEKEIADELHLSAETVTWLITRGVKGGQPLIRFDLERIAREAKTVVECWVFEHSHAPAH